MAPPAAKEHWFRSHHGAPTDAKWILIARRAGTVPGLVAAVWWSLLDYASQNNPRGSVDGYDAEAMAAFFGIDDDVMAAIQRELRVRRGNAEPLIDAENTLTAWEKRQPKREDPSTERVRLHRERKRNETQSNASETRRNARGEERRVEENKRTDEEKTLSGQKENSSAPRKKGVPIPVDWQPNDKHREIAAEVGVSVSAQAERFRDWAAAKGATYRDWDAAFRNWLRNEKPAPGTNGRHAASSDPAPVNGADRKLTRPEGWTPRRSEKSARAPDPDMKSVTDDVLGSARRNG